MIYDLKNMASRRDFEVYVDVCLLKGHKVELKRVKDKRSDQQNRSLHLFFTIISDHLNEIGQEYVYFGLKGKEISLPYTPELVKNFFWKPIQKALFETDSTTKLTTTQIDRIVDVITKFFGDKGVLIEFPSLESLEKK